ADRNRSHWSTSKTPSYTKSVSWQHHQHVIVLDQVPSPGVNVPYTLTNVDVVVNKEFRYNDKVFRKIKLTDGVDLFSYEKYLCAGESCPMMYNNFPISFDDNHLSLSVAKIMVKYIKRDLLLTE
ncbi:SGNH hydrolase domain-containing protein, partial [Klebsiella pneumoniae]|uniref:SGNH hydrolase domain-containing protein n=2 Tax=Klebsiella pneumoniae TaxID=573 RepID=UPI001A99CD5D